MSVGSQDQPAPLEPEVAARAELLEHYLGTELDPLPNTLPVLAALHEVIAVAESVRDGREPPQPHDRRSLMADVQRSLTDLGDDLERELAPSRYDYFHGELASLVELFDDRGGVLRVLSATKVLLDRARRPVASQAAWRDLMTAIVSGADAETCESRARQLRELEEALGHEWIWRGQRLRELSSAGEFADCEELLSLPPSTSARVAWFVFANADVPNGYLRVGQVQFFSHRLWPDAVTSREFMARIAGSDFPEELDEHAIALMRLDDDAEAHVYARVELVGERAHGERNPWAHGRPPANWARELVAAIVEAATFRVGGSAWRLLSGDAVYHGTISDESGTFGNWSTTTPFVDPPVYEENRRRVHPLREGTGEALESLEPRFAELLAENSTAANDAVGEVRWYEATRRQTDPAQRVVLHVRAFERALPMTGNERWNEVVKRYFREFWALDRFDDALFQLAHKADLLLSRHNKQALEQLEQFVVHDGDRFSVALGAFLREANEIGNLLPRMARIERREMRRVARWAAAGAAAHERVTELEQRFDTLLNRALQQRNAVVHGIKTVPEVVATVDGFVSRLAAYVVAQSVDAAGTGEDAIEALERGRQRSRRILWRLSSDSAPVDRILYQGSDEEG